MMLSPRARWFLDEMRTIAPAAAIMRGGKLCEGWTWAHVAGGLELMLADCEPRHRPTLENALADATARADAELPTRKIVPLRAL